MLADTNLQSVSQRIANFYNMNTGDLSRSINRIGSGKKYLNPSENAGYYFRAQGIDRQNSANKVVLQDLLSVRGTLSIADEIGTNIHANLSRMQELVKLYYGSDATQEEQIVWKSEFDALKSTIDGTVSSALYDGRQIMSDSSANPLRTARLDPGNPSNDIEIKYDAGDVVDASGLSIIGPDEATVMAGVQEQLDTVMGFLGKTSAYIFGVQAQTSLTLNKTDNNNALLEKIQSVDDADEMSKMVDFSIRQQSSLAMLSQAGMYRSNVLSLVLNM